MAGDPIRTTSAASSKMPRSKLPSQGFAKSAAVAGDFGKLPGDLLRPERSAEEANGLTQRSARSCAEAHCVPMHKRDHVVDELDCIVMRLYNRLQPQTGSTRRKWTGTICVFYLGNAVYLHRFSLRVSCSAN